MEAQIFPTQRAENLLYALFDAAGDGCHVITAGAGPFTAVVPFHNTGNRTYLGQGIEMADVVATTSLALAGEVCGVVLRTNAAEGMSRAWGWRLGGAIATPLTAGELRRAYSTDCLTGEALPLEPGLYCDDAPQLHLI
ncbi:hypothetical protein [Streptomyces sp. ISL-86]|uniref:hypothetical protein n=1 Tax=Streptomyces sp. ISL-86 TaxID=2819187 RepID=UPI001BEA594D|nr:hypothetical protein [Streptomyces sp. ISL-86]MBT2459989.1 hypothetical protein [Streptomyces sp. ISL-86]